MATDRTRFGQCAGAIAAALFVAAIGIASVGDTHAQSNQKNQKKAQPAAKGPPAGMRKGMVGPGGRGMVGPGGRGAMVPRGQMLGPGGRFANPNMKGPNVGPFNAKGPNAAPFNAKGPNATAPNARMGNFGPNGRFGNNQPGNRLGNNQPGNRFGNNQPGGRFGNQQGNRGNQPGNRFGNQQGRGNQFARGFTNRDPMRRAINARTPQLRQVQRVSHRSEMFAVRARMPIFPLPGERNFSGIPPVAERRYVNTEMVCQWGPDMTSAGIEEVARRYNLTILGVQRSALTGGTLVHFSINGNRAARDLVHTDGRRADHLAAELRVRRRAGACRRPIARRRIRSNMSSTSCAFPKCTRLRPARACSSR